MNLVSYSDSEGSDIEAAPAPKTAAKPAQKARLVNADTHKVKVNLSSLAPSNDANENNGQDARPAKRQKTGGGLNINAFLPPPKKPSQQLGANNGEGKKIFARGLGKGINLKTGAEPAFTRSEPSSLDLDGEPKDIKEVIAELRKSRTTAGDNTASITSTTTPKDKDVKMTGSAMRFKPLSVSRNVTKKKKTPGVAAPTTTSSGTTIEKVLLNTPADPLPSGTAMLKKPKVSLFSIAKEDAASKPTSSTGEYQSAFAEEMEISEVPVEAFDSIEQTPTTQANQTTSSSATGQGVSGLNLSQADMRQLFGRKAGKRSEGPDLSSIKMINFNTDAEYAANEELRAKGESITHNPVRALNPGKHSLKQLVNAAATQKDALEEHFAQGKRNRNEAGSRYGW